MLVCYVLECLRNHVGEKYHRLINNCQYHLAFGLGLGLGNAEKAYHVAVGQETPKVRNIILTP